MALLGNPQAEYAVCLVHKLLRIREMAIVGTLRRVQLGPGKTVAACSAVDLKGSPGLHS